MSDQQKAFHHLLGPGGPPGVPPLYRIPNDQMREALVERGVSDVQIWGCPCCDNLVMYGLARRDHKPILFLTISPTFYETGGGIVIGLDADGDVDMLVDFYRSTPRSFDAGFIAAWFTVGLREVLAAAWASRTP